MSDRINLNATIDLEGDEDSVDITFTSGDSDDITLILAKLKAFLIAIGYEWVETVAVQASDPETGDLVVHTSDGIFIDDMGEPEGTA